MFPLMWGSSSSLPLHSHWILGLEPVQRPGAVQESVASRPSARVGTVTAGFWVRPSDVHDGWHVSVEQSMIFFLDHEIFTLVVTLHTSNYDTYSCGEYLSARPPEQGAIDTELIRSRVWLSEVIDDDAAVFNIYVPLQQWHSSFEGSVKVTAGRVEYDFWLDTFWPFTLGPNYALGDEAQSNSVRTLYNNTESDLARYDSVIKGDTVTIFTECSRRWWETKGRLTYTGFDQHQNIQTLKYLNIPQIKFNM